MSEAIRRDTDTGYERMEAEVTAENELYLALTRLVKERGKELDGSPLAELSIPLKGGESLTVPLLLLSTAK